LVGAMPMEAHEPIRMQHTPQSLADSMRRFAASTPRWKTGLGEGLPEVALAQDLGVNHIRVRDALNRLVGDGMAVRVPYKGVRAIAVSPDDLEDLYDIRALLEGLAAEPGAERTSREERDGIWTVVSAPLIPWVDQPLVRGIVGELDAGRHTYYERR
jgi:DNA-binding FadR family transcriptional regulator